MGTWSAPTGTSVALNDRMSAAWLIGYTTKPSGTDSPIFFCRISSLTVGLSIACASVTRFMKYSASSLISVIIDWMNRCDFKGSMPTAR